MITKIFIYLFYLVLTIAFQNLLISCGQTKKPNSKIVSKEIVQNHELLSDSIQFEEDLITDSIHKLKEVIDRAQYVNKHSKGTRHLQFLVWDRPNSDNPYYWIKVMEDNGTSKYTHFDFYAKLNPFQLMYYDIGRDTVLELTTWRKAIK